MKITKNELKTWHSQQSDIDMFSKLENNFLQKFFRLNLIDYFKDIMINLHEIYSGKKIINKNNKALLNHLFKVERPFFIGEFQQKIHSFYKHRSKSFENDQLTHVFKIRYSNLNPVKDYIKKGQLILFDIKIKAEIEKLQNIPIRNIDFLQSLCRNDIYLEDEIIKKVFDQYNGEYINLFIVYYGDINFHLVRKKHYEREIIKIFGKNIKLRIFTFFISKQALLETFRSMNKITTLDHINDLVIQYYELKREKKKIKEQKKEQQKKNNIKNSQIFKLFGKNNQDMVKYFVSGFGVLAVFAITYKMLH